MSTTELNAREEIKEAQSIQDQLEKGDTAGLKEHINRLYSEHGLKELKEVLGRVQKAEEKDGISLAIKENGSGLPDVTITGTDSRTHKHIDFKFNAAADGAYLKKDGEGRPTEFRTPDGKEYRVEYAPGSDEPKKITIPEKDGSKTTLEKTAQGWEIRGKGVTDITNISVDRETGAVTIESSGRGATTTRPDGSVAERDTRGRLTNEVDAHGQETKYEYNSDDDLVPSRLRVREHGSSLTEIKNAEGKRIGYEFKDKNGHAETLQKNDDGSWTLSRGDKQEDFPPKSKIEIDPDGERRITKPDGSSFTGKADGTTVAKDKAGRVTEITSPDGTTTTIKRASNGKPTEFEVKDEAGRVVEFGKNEGGRWISDLKDPLGSSAQIKDIKVNDKDGSYVVTLENGNSIERRVDGTENFKDSRGKEIETKDDQFVKKIKDAKLPLTEAEERALRADLASIARLPAEQRDKVYASLDTILSANTDGTTKLTFQERSSIVTSLAHQIANPETINQGYKDACVMANTEQTIAKTHPDVYADMVAKLSTEGKYMAANGRTVEVNRDKDGGLGDITDPTGKRSLASEVFQNAAANLALPEGTVYKSYKPNDPDSRGRDGNLPSGVYPSTDSGERLRMVSNKSADSGEDVISRSSVFGVYEIEVVAPFEGFGSAERAKMLNAIVPADKYEPRPIRTAEQLLKAYDDNNGPPLNIGFSLKGEEGKFAGMGAGDAGTGADSHAVNITRIETGPDGTTYVYYDNPAGGADHSWPRGKGVPIDDFVKAVRATNQRAVVRTGHGR